MYLTMQDATTALLAVREICGKYRASARAGAGLSSVRLWWARRWVNRCLPLTHSCDNPLHTRSPTR